MIIGTEGPPMLSEITPYQKVVIAKNKWWGNTLWLDDVLNVCEKDEFIYHEMIVHVPMFTHPDPRRVLIIGGGDGGSAREALKHPNLEKCVMIDIDEVVVNGCKKYLPSLNNGAFDDPNLELIIGDGIEYVRNTPDNSFDVIIVDSTDPIPDSCGEVLFTEEFYDHVKRILTSNGVVSTQSIMPMRYDDNIYRNAMSSLQASFTKKRTYVCLIHTDSYNGCTSLGLCFKGESHPKKIDRERIRAFSKLHKLKCYNYGIHMGSLCLPNFLRETLGLTDE